MKYQKTHLGATLLKAEQNEPNDLSAEAALGLKTDRALWMQ